MAEDVQGSDVVVTAAEWRRVGFSPTFGQGREFYADRAFGLYKLRYVTVHAGNLTPPLDEVFAEQLERMTAVAVRTILGAARSGPERVEQVIAYCLGLNKPTASTFSGRTVDR